MRSQNVGWGNLLLDDLAFIDDQTHRQFPSTELAKDDVLLNITGASIGRTALADARLAGGNVNQHVCIIRTDINSVAPGIVNRLLLSASGQHQIDSFQAGGNRQGLNFSQIASILLPLPSKISEQKAIVDALTDADGLIQSLERLIAKKRHIKQGVMQELLTGRQRLPGFASTSEYRQTDFGRVPADWAVAEIRRLCAMKSGNAITSASIYEFAEFRCYGGNGLRGFTTRFTHNGDYVLIGRQGALCGNVFFADGKFFASEHAIVVTPADGTDVRWLALVLGRMRLNQYSESSAQPGLSVSKLLRLRLAYPTTEVEQTAIAETLSDMDFEIEALEKKLDKARQIKQGMMQELLTGRIRLI